MISFRDACRTWLCFTFPTVVVVVVDDDTGNDGGTGTSTNNMTL